MKNITPTIGLVELAQLLHRTPGALRGRLAKLYDKGFPKPLPACGLVWSRVQVEDWIARNGTEPPPEGAPDPVASARAYLESRMAGRAA